VRTVTLRRPDGRAGSHREWLRAESARWAAASDDERTASQAAARARYADLNRDRPKAQDGSSTLLLVYDEIGFWGITAADLVADLMTISGDLELHLNTPGGDVFDGIAIANALKQRTGQVKVVVDGLAASIGSVIAMAASPGQLVMMPNATMMIHDAWGLCIGDADDMGEMQQLLDQQSGNIADIYAARSGRPAADWRATMKAESWMVGQEAVEAGLADSLGTAPAAAATAAAAATGPMAGLQVIVLDTKPAGDKPAGSPRAEDADGAPCKTCGGSGRLKHPETGKPGKKCPSCDGTGTYTPDGDDDGSDDDGGQDEGAGDDGAAQDRGGSRILGIESMPVLDKAIAVHHTATVDTAWDGPAAVAAMPAEYATLHYCHAWQSADADASSHTPGDDDADDTKGNFKFPHHAKEGGPANLAACRNGLARLSGADIPAGDDAGVKAHLQAHLDDGSDGKDDTSDHADMPVWLRDA
jgi:ATP-dependent protease ClpP protease subunit